MAIKASAHITLSRVVGIEAYNRYYLLQSSTLATPTAPTEYPPGDTWSETEPAYTPDSTESLYFTDAVLFSDGTFEYSDVSLSSSYEAAKTAYNSAIAAGASASEALNAASAAQESADTTASNLNGIIGGVQDELDTVKGDIEGIKDESNAVYEIVYQNRSKIAELVQTSSGFEMSFETITDSIKQINDQYVSFKDEQYKYIRFEDGKIYLGKKPEEGEEDLQLVISNDRISFLINNVEVAYFSDDALYVTNVTVTGKLTVGRWEWSERSNGNLGLRWVGGEA